MKFDTNLNSSIFNSLLLSAPSFRSDNYHYSAYLADWRLRVTLDRRYALRT